MTYTIDIRQAAYLLLLKHFDDPERASRLRSYLATLLPNHAAALRQGYARQSPDSAVIRDSVPARKRLEKLVTVDEYLTPAGERVVQELQAESLQDFFLEDCRYDFDADVRKSCRSLNEATAHVVTKFSFFGTHQIPYKV